MTQPYPPGTVLDLGGAYAIYYPYTRPCYEPYDQWVIFYQEGTVETTRESPMQWRVMDMVPFMTHPPADASWIEFT